MEYQETRAKKLLFKGEKCTVRRGKVDKRKHKHKSKTKPNNQHRSDTNAGGDRDASDGWVPVMTSSDLDGPLAFFFRDELVYVLSLPPQEETQAQAISEVGSMPPVFLILENTSLMEAEPSRIEQVFVGRKSVPATEPTDPEARMHSFKSYTGTYLSADRHGNVECKAVAIGPLEMWTPVLLPERGDGAIALTIRPPGSSEDCFLSVETHKTTGRQLQVHAGASSIGFCQVFTAKCQAALRKKRIVSSNPGIDNDIYSPSANSTKSSKSHTETLLDRREKSKSDRYCK
ncbi:hypothetical protein GGF37_002122 [Kickxella alabastrina]|nr:hypothetical protein GGF37_002122 [Kickxella alabastrina]